MNHFWWRRLVAIGFLLITALAASRVYVTHNQRVVQKTSADCFNCNVFIIDINLLRADALNCNDNETITPNICHVMRSGYWFKNHASQSIQTKSSVISMLASLYESSHGIWADFQKLNPQVVTLPKILHDHGYTTTFIGDTQLLGIDPAMVGFEQVFTVAQQSPTQYQQIERIVQKTLSQHKPFFLYIIDYDLHLPYFLLRDNQQPRTDISPSIVPTTNDELNTSIEEYISIHYREIFKPAAVEANPAIFQGNGTNKRHAMYTLFLRYSKNSEEKVKFLNDVWMVTYNSYFQHVDGTNPEHIKIIKSKYLALLENIDKQLGTILDLVQKDEYKNNTIVVIKAAHGEEFYEHRSFSHQNNLYQELIHTPLVIHTPRGSKNETQSMSQDIDLSPTLLQLLELPIPSQFQGKSLISLFGNPHKTVDDVQVSQKGGGAIATLNKSNWKVFVNRQAPLELYDLIHDPLEQHNIFGQNQRSGWRLFHAYQLIMRHQKTYTTLDDPLFKTIDETKRQHLMKEGYY